MSRLFHACYMCRSSHFLTLITLTICGEEYKLWNYEAPHYSTSRAPVASCPVSTNLLITPSDFVPHLGWQSFTPTQNKIIIHFNPRIFLDGMTNLSTVSWYKDVKNLRSICPADGRTEEQLLLPTEFKKS